MTLEHIVNEEKGGVSMPWEQIYQRFRQTGERWRKHPGDAQQGEGKHGGAGVAPHKTGVGGGIFAGKHSITP